MALVFLLAGLPCSITLAADTIVVQPQQAPGQSTHRGISTAIPGIKKADPPPKEKIIDGKVLIRRIEVRGDALFPQYGVTNDYISRRLNHYVDQRSQWMSISDMHRLADDLTLAYHEKGLTFNQVFVLPQEIRDETLTLNVLAGRLSEVNVMNNQLYQRDQIADPFVPLLGQVIYEPDIRLTMDEINALPGLNVFGFYSVGRRQGETRLNVRVQKETAQRSTLYIDNWGVQSTGESRITLSHARNNLAGKGDTLQALMMATGESGNFYGGLNYSFPWTRDTRLTASVSSNQFEVAGDLEQFGFEGTLHSVQGVSDTRLLDEAMAKARALVSVGVKRSSITSELFRDVFEQNIDYITLEPGIRMSVLRPDIRISQGLYLAPLLGHITQSDTEAVDENFWGLKTQYTFQHLWNKGIVAGQLSTLNLHGLVTETVLPDAERLPMTGAISVRGYEPALFSADQVYRLAFEHSLRALQAPAGIATTPFLFLDAVYGEQNDEFANTATFIAAGFGIELTARQGFSGKVTLGFPVSESTSATLAKDDFKPIIYGQFGLQF